MTVLSQAFTVTHAAPLVLVAHGSRLNEAKASIERLIYVLENQRPNLRIYESYIELCRPSLPSVLKKLQGNAIVVPLLLTRGVHLANDVYAIAKDFGYPASRSLGPDQSLVKALDARLHEVNAPGSAHIVLAAAGSKDPVSNQDVEEMAAQLSQERDAPVSVGYLGSHLPNFFDIANKLRSEKVTVAVSTYLLNPGRFSNLVATSGVEWIAEPLGLHPVVSRIILDRYDQALIGASNYTY